MLIQVVLGESCATARPGMEVPGCGCGEKWLVQQFACGRGLETDGSLRHTNNSSGTPQDMVPSTGWGCCCWHSRDLGSEMLREDAGPRGLGLKAGPDTFP